MKTEWMSLGVSAFIDGAVVFLTGLISAMMTTGQAVMPTVPVIVVLSLGSLLIALRKVQTFLKPPTPETVARLKGVRDHHGK